MPKTSGLTRLAAEKREDWHGRLQLCVYTTKKFCLVQYPALALTKVWKSRALHTPEYISSSFYPTSSSSPANTNSNYGWLRQPLKEVGSCLEEKQPINKHCPKKKKKAIRDSFNLACLVLLRGVVVLHDLMPLRGSAC